MTVQYEPDPRGLAEVGRSAGMQAAVLEAAHRGAAAARSANPAGQYVVEPTLVRTGYRDEPRAGAIITDTAPNSMRREAETRALAASAVAAIEGGA